MKNSRLRPVSAPIALTWDSHASSYRVTPDLQFEMPSSTGWVGCQPDPMEDSFLEAEMTMPDQQWVRFLEFVDPLPRSLVGCFRLRRLAALAVAAHCPALVPQMLEAQTLVPALAGHVTLRGETHPRWDQINAVFDCAGIFGLLEWLGFPSSRQTLSVLKRLASPDLAPSRITPLRESLWNPEDLSRLLRSGSLTEAEIIPCDHGVAA